MEMYKELTSLKIASTTKQLKTQTVIAGVAAALYSGVTQEGVTGEDEAWGGAAYILVLQLDLLHPPALC